MISSLFINFGFFWLASLFFFPCMPSHRALALVLGYPPPAPGGPETQTRLLGVPLAALSHMDLEARAAGATPGLLRRPAVPWLGELRMAVRGRSRGGCAGCLTEGCGRSLSPGVHPNLPKTKPACQRRGERRVSSAHIPGSSGTSLLIPFELLMSYTP